MINRLHQFLAPVITCLLLTAAHDAVGASHSDADPHTEEDLRVCLMQELEQAEDSDTVGAIRERCKIEVTAKKLAQSSVPVLRLIERRVLLEKEASKNRFAIIQHRPSYILPVSYNSRINRDPFASLGDDFTLDHVEAKFQFSIKAQLMDGILEDRGRIYFGYTNQSYWQLFNQENSGPFRETNHEPELFLDMDHDFTLAGWHVPLVRMGWVHQSNGRAEPLSRSWNRIYGQIFFEKGKWAISFKPWIRVNGDSAETDNPDIDDYMGNFELGIYRQSEHSAASLRLRNNLRSENRGSVEFNWSRSLPYNDKIRLLFQYFYGYGESLIDYNAITERVGLGLQLSDFL
jgi:phospholipase A1